MYRYLRSDVQTNDMMNNMLDIMEYQSDPKVGSFWYDPDANELFGVYSMLAEDARPYKSEFGDETRTGSQLHERIWEKEKFRKRDVRFQGDYTKVPRGRVFQIGSKFVVMTGDWINNYPDARPQILMEFDLPQDAEFRTDVHWDIGHGWSNVGLC